MINKKQFGDGFNDLQSTQHIKQLILTNQHTQEVITLENIPGKQASVTILFNIASNAEQTITSSEALTGLALFGDYAAEEKQKPNSHPNIRLLLDIIDSQGRWVLTTELH